MNVKLFSIVLGIPLLIAGCGDSGPDRGPLGTLSGKVSFEGTPLTQGYIYIQHQDGAGTGGGGGEIQSDGTYSIEGRNGGVPAGKYVVWFAPAEMEVSGSETEPADIVDIEMPNMPEKYRSAKTSGLTVEIIDGGNTQSL